MCVCSVRAYARTYARVSPAGVQVCHYLCHYGGEASELNPTVALMLYRLTYR